MRGVVLVAAVLLVACGSSKQEETPKPPLVVDCHASPPSTVPPQIKCGGICVPHDTCADAAGTCPAGYVTLSGECENDALCCGVPEAGADGSTDGPADAPPEAEDAPAG